MSKTIALAIGMTGTFYPHNHKVGEHGVRAEITKVWSETCVNIISIDGVDHLASSVFVPPVVTPATKLPLGYYFLPDAFVEAQSAGPDQQVEQAIVQAGADKAPRVTPADIEANIVNAFFFSAEDGVVGSHRGEVVHSDQPHSLSLLTFCVLVLKNGFTVTGESACASPANFNAEIGKRIARENAVAKIWPLMGYELRTKLANAPKPNAVDPQCVFRYCPSDDDCKARGRCVNRP